MLKTQKIQNMQNKLDLQKAQNRLNLLKQQQTWKKRNLSKRMTAFVLGTVMLLSGCSGTDGWNSSSGKTEEPIASRLSYALNTEIQIDLYGTEEGIHYTEKEYDEILTECLSICSRYEKKLSRTIEDSEISVLNAQKEAELSEDTLELLEKGLYYSEISEGAFDIAIEPISSLWDFSSGEGTVPDASLIESRLPYVDYHNIQIEGNHVTLGEGMGIDLGAIAKGYIADQIKSYLTDMKINSATINLGGNVLCIGKKPSGSEFGIGIRDPKNTAGIKAAVYVEDCSVVTSGTYERYIEQDGKTYHHILNPHTGYSYENELDSVTIISDVSVDGDGLSTTCFALGLEKGLELIDSMDSVWAMFIDKEGNIIYSDGFLENINCKEY